MCFLLSFWGNIFIRNKSGVEEWSDGVMKPVLSVKQLTKSFGSRTIIENLSFSILPGNRVTIFAPSGSGKSSLIHILSKLDQSFSGTFSLSSQRSSTVFQEARLFSYMTVQENIFFPLRVQQTSITDSVREHYTQWLEVCGLTEYQHHYPYQLSGGMKQKVSLIRGFITNPDFVMMDEPFASIDFVSKNRIIRHILRCYPETTLLFVTHNLDEIPLLAKTLLVFHTPFLADFTEYSDVASLPVSELFSRIFRELSDIDLSK